MSFVDQVLRIDNLPVYPSLLECWAYPHSHKEYPVYVHSKNHVVIAVNLAPTIRTITILLPATDDLSAFGSSAQQLDSEFLQTLLLPCARFLLRLEVDRPTQSVQPSEA